MRHLRLITEQIDLGGGSEDLLDEPAATAGSFPFLLFLAIILTLPALLVRCEPRDELHIFSGHPCQRRLL